MYLKSFIYRLLAFILLLVTGSIAGVMQAESQPSERFEAGKPEMLNPDTSTIYTIDEITVTSKRRNAELRSVSPFQLLTSEQLQRINALQVSDAVKFFTGVNVKDYGGIGGLKTVSVRSLGASHTALSYDGIIVNDNQTGQMDIGRFSLDNVETLTLHNGQSDRIFQPARQFASAAVLSIRSRSPFEGINDRMQGSMALKAGSFGMFNPSLFLRKKFSPGLAAGFSAEYLRAHGRYPYRLFYHPSGTGDFSNEVRTNTDVSTLRVEGSLHAHLSEKESAWLKLYYYTSHRGLPGATILYASENFATQRIDDRTFFARAHYDNNLNQRWSLQWNANYHNAFLHYSDTAYFNLEGRQESVYLQQEFYSSLALLYKALPRLSVAFSTDAIAGNMDAHFENEKLTGDFVQPSRYTLLNVIASNYVTDRFHATISLLSTAVFNTVNRGAAAPHRHRFSPYTSVSWQPFAGHDLRMRAFYKNIFRMPTFSDLYYSRVGNSLLKPEITDQWNLGVTWTDSPANWWPQLSVTADIYHNRVNDKIIALPTKNLFTWSMRNLGEVRVNGLDLSVETAFSICNDYELKTGASYSYQRALDYTDPESGTYLHQIPYTPRISGSVHTTLGTPLADLSYTIVWSGKRYSTGENYAENRLPAYSDHGISLTKKLKTGRSLLHLKAEVNNLLNKNYELIKWYPMPGRSYRLTATVELP